MSTKQERAHARREGDKSPKARRAVGATKSERVSLRPQATPDKGERDIPFTGRR